MKFLIAGDYAPCGRVAKKVHQCKFDEVFPKELLDVIKSSDFSFVNFESPVIEDGYKPIPKCGPNLSCYPGAVEALKYAGFTGVTMANNHIMDYGIDGLKKSVECCRNQGLDVVGVGQNLKEATNILYLENCGSRIAVINCCEHEFNIATDTSAGANPLNPIAQYYTIKEAKKCSDYVLIIIHGGHEHYRYPSLRMQEIYRFFIDSGADAVVNHHQHCYSGYEVYNGKPIFYGLGNFCFDLDSIKVDSKWYYGYMVEIEFDAEVRFKIYPYKQCSELEKVELLPLDSFKDEISSMNAIINDECLLRKVSEEYYMSSHEDMRNFMEPIPCRWILAAQRRHLLPSFILKKWLIKMYNVIFCEAHRDKLLSYMNYRIFKDR